MNSVTARSSFTGTVLGMHATAVNPPAAAARVPVSIVSFHSCPGSEVNVHVDEPGATTRPRASITRAPFEAILDSSREIFPSSTRRSRTTSVPVAGRRCAPLKQQLHASLAREQVQDGIPDGHALREGTSSVTAGRGRMHIRVEASTRVDRPDASDHPLAVKAPLSSDGRLVPASAEGSREAAA